MGGLIFFLFIIRVFTYFNNALALTTTYVVRNVFQKGNFIVALLLQSVYCITLMIGPTSVVLVSSESRLLIW